MAGNSTAGAVTILQLLSAFAFASVVMSAARVARALNSWTKEGLDMLGGADGAALAELISEFMAAPGSEDEPQECKNPALFNIH